MILYFIIGILAAQWAWARPLPQLNDVPHIVIVTPQAQVHLEPSLKYDAPATIFHHLSPLSRFTAPHDETIVYVPTGATAPLLTLDAGHVAGRSTNVPLKQKADNNPYDQIIQSISGIQSAIQEGSAMYGPQLSEAASQAAAAASSAGSGLFPSLFPPSSTGSKDSTLKTEKADLETLNAAKTLISNDGRRFYALNPIVPQILDFVHSPIFGPISTIRARSILETEKPTANEKLKDRKEIDTDVLVEKTMNKEFDSDLEINSEYEKLEKLKDLPLESNEKEKITTKSGAVEANLSNIQPKSTVIVDYNSISVSAPKVHDVLVDKISDTA